MKYKLLIIIAIIVGVLTSANYFARDEKVLLSDPKWNCIKSNDKWKCTVSLEVTNETHMQQFRKISIRGIVTSRGKYGRIAMHGEKIFDIEMSPKETFQVTENLMFDRKPFDIKVKIWE